MDINEKERIEIDYWKNSSYEAPGNFTAGNFINKSQECLNLNYKINKFSKHILSKKNILEIGAGQGWASCFMKRFYLPEAHFTTTDISPYAIQSLKYWEAMFDVEIDNSYPSKSYELKENDQSFDLIFCYAAAHHFVLYEQCLAELKRVLKDDGCIFFFYEPTSSRLFYPLHHWYVNTIKHVTPEDVIVPSQLRVVCEKLSLNYINYFDAEQIINRSIATSLYFKFLKLFPFMQKILPSSSDLFFEKSQ